MKGVIINQSVESRKGDECLPEDSFCVEWYAYGTGFGEFRFIRTGGKTYIENEGMSKYFIKRMMCRMIDDAILTG